MSCLILVLISNKLSDCGNMWARCCRGWAQFGSVRRGFLMMMCTRKKKTKTRREKELSKYLPCEMNVCIMHTFQRPTQTHARSHIQCVRQMTVWISRIVTAIYLYPIHTAPSCICAAYMTHHTHSRHSMRMTFNAIPVASVTFFLPFVWLVVSFLSFSAHFFYLYLCAFFWNSKYHMNILKSKIENE